MIKKNVSRRDFLKVTGLGLGGATLAACAPSTVASKPAAAEPTAAPAAESENVLFWKPPHSAKEAELWPPLLEKFTASNPGITIDHQVVPWGNVTEQFTAAFAGGSPPDVFYLPDEWYPKYVNDGQIADLSGKIGAWKDNYTETAWKGATYKGKTWGMPFLGVAQGFICNLNLFKKKGVSVPTNMEEFRAVAKACTDPAAGTYGIAPMQDTFSSWIHFIPLLATGGASLLNDDLTKFAANTKGGVAAFKTFYEDIVAGDKTSTPLGFTKDQFDSAALAGKVGMKNEETSYIKAAWRAQAPDIELASVPFLKLTDDGKNGSWANIGFMFMAKSSAEKAGAFKLLDYLSTNEMQVEYVQKGVDLLPLKKNIAPLPNADPLVTEIVAGLDKGWGVGTTISIRFVEVCNILQQEIESIMTGQKSAADALASAEKLINPVLDGQ